jgi:hypothetical protein
VPASTSGADNELAVPPLAVGESFGQAYDVILILDSREQFCHNAKGYTQMSPSKSCWFKSQLVCLWFLIITSTN